MDQRRQRLIGPTAFALVVVGIAVVVYDRRRRAPVGESPAGQAGSINVDHWPPVPRAPGR